MLSKKKNNVMLMIGILSLTLLLNGKTNAQFNLVKTITIESGQTTSSPIDMREYKLAAIIFPSAMTGTSVTIATSNDTTSANFKVVQYNGNNVSISVGLDKQCGVPPAAANQLLRYIKIVSNATETAQRILSVVYTVF